MRLIAVALMLVAGLAGAEKWSVFRSEPFAVYTNGKDKEAREALAMLLQVQHTLSAQFGKDWQPSWAVTGGGEVGVGAGGIFGGVGGRWGVDGAVDSGEYAAV
ncbi:MAG: hypothetical protein NTV52_26885 [Acidobacteria bacterium]|nr:hypothetical protein [Acidobacteriota bacterium]